MSEPIIEVRHLSKSFGTHVVLRDVDFTVNHGDVTCVIGASGSGKSTLLNMIGGLDVPTSGQVVVDGKELSKLKDEELTVFRRRKIGFIFQGFNLISNLTAIENVELPLIYRGIGRSERHKLAMEALNMVGLEKRIHHKPAEMSGGQQQRVAIARAIAAKPPVILADEPTGNLDSASTKEIMGILRSLHDTGRSVILITHDNDIADQAKRVVRILDGKIVEDYYNEEQVKE